MFVPENCLVTLSAANCSLLKFIITSVPWNSDTKKFAAKNWGTREMSSDDARAAVHTRERKGAGCFNECRWIEITVWDSRIFYSQGSSRKQSKWINQSNRYAYLWLRKALACGDAGCVMMRHTDHWCFLPSVSESANGQWSCKHEMGFMIWLVVFRLEWSCFCPFVGTDKRYC